MDVTLYGKEAEKIRPIVDRHDALSIVDSDPDTVICFGGDGTLLTAEHLWPGVPKVPLRNSRRGIRCIPDPPEQVIGRLAEGTLVPKRHLKLSCDIAFAADESTSKPLLAINEFSVHMGRMNSSLRFHIWFDDRPYGAESDHELIGDGFVVSTPFGSTAYFNQITGGVFWEGIGVALMYTGEPTNHVVVPEDTVVRARIARGPGVLAHDGSPEFVELSEGDELTIRKADEYAILLTTDT